MIAEGADVVIGHRREMNKLDIPGAEDRTSTRSTSWAAGWRRQRSAVRSVSWWSAGIRVGVLLAHTGRRTARLEVILIESTEMLCLELGLPGRWRLLHDLQAAGVVLVRRVPGH